MEVPKKNPRESTTVEVDPNGGPYATTVHKCAISTNGTNVQNMSLQIKGNCTKAFMGNCCWGGEPSEGTNHRAFAGEGHRLGSTTNEGRNYGGSYGTSARSGSEMPSPVVNSDLDNTDRDRIRAERVAAAEKRIKAAGGDVKKKKKKKRDSSPLRGPNSQNMMQWSVG